MELLPTAAEREQLLDELAALIAACGAETFLAAPIVPNDDTAFPDPWEGDAASVYKLLRRLQVYGGMSALGLELWLDHYGETTVHYDRFGREILGHQGVAGWFAGIEEETCHFGVDLTQLQEPQALAGTLAHEVSHAYRAWRGVVDEDRSREELLTDLTTVYLGFGVLTVNAALRFRSGSIEGLGSYWTTQQGGYLSPQSLCFLLAAQAVARGWDAGARKQLARRLETNQAASFRAACGELERGALLERLGLPAAVAGESPQEVGLPAVTFDAEELARYAAVEERAAMGEAGGEAEAAGGEADDDDEDDNDDDDKGRPTFRLAQSLAFGWTYLLGMAAAVIAPLTAMELGYRDTTALLGLGLGALVLVRLVAPKRRFDICVDESCQCELPRAAKSCPRCRRLVVGRVRHIREWREASERWESAQRAEELPAGRRARVLRAGELLVEELRTGHMRAEELRRGKQRGGGSV